MHAFEASFQAGRGIRPLLVPLVGPAQHKLMFGVVD